VTEDAGKSRNNQITSSEKAKQDWPNLDMKNLGVRLPMVMAMRIGARCRRTAQTYVEKRRPFNPAIEPSRSAQMYAEQKSASINWTA